MKTIYIDTETTGLDPELHDIWQLSGIIEIDGKVMQEFDCKIRPVNFASITDEALRVGGVTVENLEAFPPVQHVFNWFEGLLGEFVDPYDRRDKFTFYGFNAPFDDAMLRAWFKKCGCPYYGSYFWWPVVDVAGLAHTKLMKMGKRQTMPNFKLGTVAEALGITPEGELHNALTDIRLTRAIKIKLEEL